MRARRRRAELLRGDVVHAHQDDPGIGQELRRVRGDVGEIAMKGDGIHPAPQCAPGTEQDPLRALPVVPVQLGGVDGLNAVGDLDYARGPDERIERDLKKNRTADLERERDLLLRCKEALEDGRPLRGIDMNDAERKMLRGFQFLSAKPLLLVINLDESDIGDVAAGIETAAAKAGLTSFLANAETKAVALCAKIELEISQLDDEDRKMFLTELGLTESGLDRVIRTAYDLLGYMSFFTVGEDECRAWTIPRGTKAPLAAGAIHSDIERGFIRAQVVPYEELVATGSIAACREKGTLRLEGREYEVKDGDVIEFKFNV